MRTACILSAALLLSACTTMENEINAQFNAYVGKPLSQAILRYGPPATTMELDGKKYYGWRVDWQGEPCQWTFSVQDNTITAAQWNGSPNACWSMTYYKH